MESEDDGVGGVELKIAGRSGCRRRRPGVSLDPHAACAACARHRSLGVTRSPPRLAVCWRVASLLRRRAPCVRRPPPRPSPSLFFFLGIIE
jgi:hypothetical protein